MGKRIIQQRRGRGSFVYRAHSFRFKGKASNKGVGKGKIIDLIHCAGHSAPLMKVLFESGEEGLCIACEGVKVGDFVNMGGNHDSSGNVVTLREIPEGSLIHNIEIQPGDGGKFVRASGTFARVITKTPEKIIVKLPSKKIKAFNPDCRASMGIVAGGGRPEKPFLKAGRRYHKMRAKNKLYPIVNGAAMSAVDHPFGNKRTSRKSKARPAPHNAPPGRKVGMIRPRRTGRKKK